MEIDSMQHLVGRMLKAADVEEAVELNRALAGTIVSAARNEYLSKALSSLDGVVELLNGTTYGAYPERRMEAARAHARTIDAIARRDGKMAEEAARQYVRDSAKVRIAMMFGEKLTSSVIEPSPA
jgi:DNA-binding GntR family transcriptional regulator